MSILNNEITTPRQVKNGTRAFLCERTGAIYTSHSNGYVRRQIISSIPGHSGQYQINPTAFYSNERKCKVRIMIHNESDRLALIERRAASYRSK